MDKKELRELKNLLESFADEVDILNQPEVLQCLSLVNIELRK